MNAIYLKCEFVKFTVWRTYCFACSWQICQI